MDVNANFGSGSDGPVQILKITKLSRSLLKKRDEMDGSGTGLRDVCVGGVCVGLFGVIMIEKGSTFSAWLPSTDSFQLEMETSRCEFVCEGQG